jgi:hypothetical protein
VHVLMNGRHQRVPASPFVPQRPTDIEEICQGNLSKLRRHLGKSIPSDLIPPRFDGDEVFDGLSGDAEVYSDVPTTTERLLELTDCILEKRTDERDEKRWLR